MTMAQFFKSGTILTLALLTSSAQAAIEVKDAVVRMPELGFSSTQISMVLKSDVAMTLISASGNFAKSIDFQVMKRKGSEVSMQAEDAIDVPANQELTLRSGEQKHFLVARKVKPSIRIGEVVHIILRFKLKDGHKIASLRVPAKVVALPSYNPNGSEVDLH